MEHLNVFQLQFQLLWLLYFHWQHGTERQRANPNQWLRNTSLWHSSCSLHWNAIFKLSMQKDEQTGKNTVFLSHSEMDQSFPDGSNAACLDSKHWKMCLGVLQKDQRMNVKQYCIIPDSLFISFASDLKVKDLWSKGLLSIDWNENLNNVIYKLKLSLHLLIFAKFS